MVFSRARIVGASALILGMVLSGCSALQIRTEKSGSGPMDIAVKDHAGGEPTPQETGEAIPAGMTEKVLSFGNECPVTVSLAIGEDWFEGSSSEGDLQGFDRGRSATDMDSVNVSCIPAYDNTAQAVVDAKKKYTFTQQGSTIKAEHTGTINAGAYWTYQGIFGSGESFAVNGKPTWVYGARAGYQAEGRMLEIGVQMLAFETDTETSEEYKKMLPTVKINGEKLVPPTFK